ncbi:hypothetical protein IB277_03825 [Ensifer sp. ENS07]|uniref:hypothetical protein n=1 Tax=Ensifer sp. ENS07 TaxID=2769274 RepID=UPI0017838DEC|nr:hypothetical protein [Ensifer sp. ENS07]MBD9635432.1 hypothetical protein [Ensifer sp. ENS07]
MNRTVSYHCDPASGYCECPDNCALPARDADLGGLKKFNRAATGFGLSLLLVFAIAIILAAGFVRTESIHRDIVFKRSV